MLFQNLLVNTKSNLIIRTLTMSILCSIQTTVSARKTTADDICDASNCIRNVVRQSTHIGRFRTLNGKTVAQSIRTTLTQSPCAER